MLRPELVNALSRNASPSLTTDFIGACHKEVKQEVMGSHHSGIVRIENRDASAELFMSAVQLFS